MRSNYYNGLPQRYRWALATHPNDGARLELRFTFQVRDVPAEPVFLLLESADRFKVRMNGQAVQNTVAGWYLDRAMTRVALPRLKAGENVLVLACAYTNYMELEDCYLLGDFGVSLAREIIDEPARLHFSDWTGQGYPHYAGSMDLPRQPGVRDRAGTNARKSTWHTPPWMAVHVNGKPAAHSWRWPTDWTSPCCSEPGTGWTRVVGSPRNMPRPAAAPQSTRAGRIGALPPHR
jgi:hypothetical protein